MREALMTAACPQGSYTPTPSIHDHGQCYFSGENFWDFDLYYIL
jgi:hypothetical protein